MSGLASGADWFVKKIVKNMLVSKQTWSITWKLGKLTVKPLIWPQKGAFMSGAMKYMSGLGKITEKIEWRYKHVQITNKT